MLDMPHRLKALSNSGVSSKIEGTVPEATIIARVPARLCIGFHQ
jgi:hypothetical protein